MRLSIEQGEFTIAYAKLIKNNYYLFSKQGIYIKSIGHKSKYSEEQVKQITKEWAEKNEAPMPNGKYDIIYADPPWRYDFSKSNSRAIESHYQTMELQDICNLKIPTKNDSILYLWATAPKLIEALKVMESWGFTYITNMVWIKPQMGMGYHARGKHELLLIGKKGNMSPPGAQQRYQSVINASRGIHSKKPDDVYSIIEEAYPPSEYKLLELFARNKRPGWEAWGNES